MEKKKKFLPNLCEQCQKNEKSRKPHTCAYRAEINGDEKPCTCCRDCSARCAEEV